MLDPLAIAIVFGALGANVLATGLLLLFNPRSASVRWYAAFLTAVSLWLFGRGALAMGAQDDAWRVAFASGVQLMPALFLAAALVDNGSARVSLSVAVTAAGIVMLPFTVPALLGPPGALTIGWHVAGWGTGSWLQVRATMRHAARFPARARRARFLARLLIVPPILAAVGIALAAEAFFTYVMPLIMIGVHFALFGGIVWLRFYDIEVRAARSGEIAARVAEAERLATVGELSASIAHELRNPLAGIRSLAQRLAEDDIDTERSRRYASVIVEEAGRLDRIVGDLLTVSRRVATRPWTGEATSLETLFDDLALLVSSRAEGAGVRLVARAEGVMAPAPREPLAQALLNLLLNAIQHSPPGGTVTVQAEATSPARPQVGRERDPLSAADRVVISVRDEGPGVPAADRERIFEPFHSAGTDGTGLGLSVVRRLARDLDWQVEVRDAPGRGAEFRLTIGARSTAGRAAVAGSGP
jgi:signal transduction histidine kinase